MSENLRGTPAVQHWLNHGDAAIPYPETGNIVCGTCSYIEADDLFRIEGVERIGYEIQAGRIQTATSLVDWLWQLSEKEWWTGQYAKDFLDCLLCYIHREWQVFPQEFYGVHGVIANRRHDLILPDMKLEELVDLVERAGPGTQQMDQETCDFIKRWIAGVREASP
jgi:hypothetical protein